MTNDDPLDNEVSVSGELTEAGVKGSAKSRAMSALDRLVGNIIDLPNPFIEGITARRRAKSKGSVRVIEALTDAAVKGIEQQQQEFARPVIEAHYREIFQKQENKEAVAQIAVENLKQIPDEKLAKDDGGGKAIGADWLNYFLSYAEKASSDQLREAFGRILSGEIQRPGTFSFSTLRIVSELDTRSAEVFQGLASRAFSLTPAKGDPSCFLRPENLEGEFLEQVLKIEALGLIQELGGAFGLNVSKSYLGSDTAWFRFGPILLRGNFKNGGSVGRLQLVKLTTAGTELCSIIPMAHETAANELGRMLAQRGMAITLHKVTGVDGKIIHFTEPGSVVTAD